MSSIKDGKNNYKLQMDTTLIGQKHIYREKGGIGEVHLSD